MPATARLPEPLIRRANVRCLLPLGTARDVETNSLTFLQGLEALALNRGEVDEEILAAVFGGDEAEALRIVEPFYVACCHVLNILRETIKGECPQWGEDQDGGVMKERYRRECGY